MKNTMIFLILCIPFAVAADVIKSAQFRYSILGQKGAMETRTLKYLGKIQMSVTQSGKSSSWLHPIDTRQCHWSIQSYIVREVCLLSLSGRAYCEMAEEKLLHLKDKGNGKRFKLRILQGENCGDLSKMIDRKYRDQEKQLLHAWDDVIKKDKANMEQVFSQDGSVKETKN